MLPIFCSIFFNIIALWEVPFALRKVPSFYPQCQAGTATPPPESKTRPFPGFE